MSVSTNQQLGIDFASQHPSDSISGVPLKKRLFCSSHCSSPSSTELNMLPKDCGRPCKQALVTEPEAAASSVNLFGLALGANVIMEESQQVLGEKHYVGNLSLTPSSENSLNRSQLNDHPATRFHDDADLKIDCVERVNLDLNIPVGSWDDVSDQVMETDENCMLGKANFQEKKLKVSSIHTPLGTQVTKTILGMSETSKSKKECSNLRRSNSSTSNDCKDSDIGLDLQLKLPSRPELRIDWAANSPPHLTLSLMGSNSDWNPGPDDRIQNRMESSQPAALLGHVNSEPSDGVPQDGTLKIACSTEQKAASVNVKLEVCEVSLQQCNDRLIRGPQNVVLDNERSTSSSIMDCQSTGRGLVLNCLTVNSERRAPACGPLLQSDPKINAGGSTDMMIGRCADLGLSRLVEAEVCDNGCNFKDVGGNVDRTSDVLVESLMSIEKESVSNVTGTQKVTGFVSSSFHDSGISDAKEPATLDGVSEGSADMECSDGEYYSTSKAVMGSEFTVDSYENNLQGERRKHVIVDEGIIRDATGSCHLAASTSHSVDKDFREVKVESDRANTWSNGTDGVRVHVKIPAKTEAKEKEVLDSQQRTDQNVENPGIKKNGKSPCSATKLLGKPNKAMTSSSSRLDKPSQVAKKNNLLNEKLLMSSKKVLSSTDAVKIGKNHEKDVQKMNTAEDNVFSAKQKLLERRSDENDGPNKHVEDGENNSQNKRISFPPAGAPLLSDRERSTDKSHERDRSNSRGRRDESMTFERNGRQDDNAGKYGYDYRNIRRNRRDDYHQSSHVHGDRAYDTRYSSEVSNSNYERYSRYESHQSHFHSRRRSPVPRDLLRPPGNQFPINPRGDTPGTYIVGDSDPHETNMRGSRNRMADRLVYPRSHMHYERSNPDKMHGERSNRVPMVSFRDHSDMLRIDRRPLRQPCFPEDMVSRRPNSPPYCSDDMSEMCAAEEFDLPSREVRINARRLDFIDQQDDMEEYQESLHFIQQPEILSDELVDFYESDGLPRHFDQQYEDEEAGLHYPPVELDQRRAIRFQPDADVVGDDRGRSRNQVGNSITARLRYSGQTEGYKYQNIPGFRDGGLENVRMKRRRL